MDFKQLEAYIKIIDNKSFSKAAEEMYLSQPSVSSYINSLENELQTKLINRSTREVIPTEAGKLFYRHSKQIIDYKDEAVTDIRSMDGGHVGRIEIRSSSVPAQYVLPSVIAKFHAAYPNVKVNLIQQGSSEVIKDVANRVAEIGFVGSMDNNEKCSFKKLMTENLVIIAPNTDKYRKLQNASLEEIMYSNYFVGREKSSGTRTQYEAFFRKNKIEIKRLKECANFDNTQGVINAVSSGLGISIVSELAAKLYTEQGLVIMLNQEDLHISRNLYYVFRKNFTTTNLIDTFIEFLENTEIG